MANGVLPFTGGPAHVSTNGSAVLPVSADLHGPRSPGVATSARANSLQSDHGDRLPDRVDTISRDSSLLARDVADQLSLESSGISNMHSDEEPVDEAVEMELPTPRNLSTGLCYDVRMRYHCELNPSKHRQDFHPEDPRRIYAIYARIVMAGLHEDKSITHGENVPLVDRPLLRVFARSATIAEVCLVHDVKHYEFIQGLRRKLVLKTNRYSREDADSDIQAPIPQRF